ncbi:hypothetical protein FPZ12_036845 [Amycolatopsis acidicola]|uniref:Secreted protein n=1 Tax=Amycolatopsis acidicola TaxID=2596893 RepID=A0A5N0UV00_9PSEU|nr:hypothetical protein [Amycolatopsis acidicola]KAA9152489.1 hypothetical protein FPZ12_036845 [Amycolatopsis acidicola]
MSTSMIIVVVVAVLVVAALIAFGLRTQRRRRLRERFGPEYDRAVEDSPNRTKAERDLLARERRHDKLDIRPLSDSAREHYRQQWSLIQERFVDRPDDAIGEADRVLTRLMADRGYPTEGYEQQVNDLSVEHARTLEHYRRARETLRGNEKTRADTEALRKAMVHYRTVFDDLLAEREGSK